MFIQQQSQNGEMPRGKLFLTEEKIQVTVWPFYKANFQKTGDSDFDMSFLEIARSSGQKYEI